MTHDLLRNVLTTLGVRLERVEITDLTDGVFHAALVLGTGARVDSRASDAIALAVRTGSPVLCSAEVVAVAGVEADDEAGRAGDGAVPAVPRPREPGGLRRGGGGGDPGDGDDRPPPHPPRGLP